MVMPTVFIGLGTSGAEIIQGVRRLLYEEYGKPGLPCISFLSLRVETNLPSSNLDVYIRDEDKYWQRLFYIPLSVSRDRLRQLRGKLDINSNDYQPGWEEWLDPAVLSGAAYVTGAKKWRMAGRFCLWANWESVYQFLIQGIRNAANGRDEAITMLENHYNAKGIPRPEGEIVEPTLRIYLCGSLCGGTCSGIFWEVGFMAQEALADAAVGVEPDIHGVFTVVDRRMANSRNKADLVCSMNCWAALLEYDYWTSGEHPYQITHPLDSGSRFPNVPNDFGPFQSFNIISPSNDTGFRSVTWTGTDYDLMPLHASISTSLYLDLVQAVRTKKDLERAQYDITGEIGKKSLNGLYRQCLQTYGLSGFYYPKFTITYAAACKLGKELVEKWIAPGNRNNAEQHSHNDWKEIYEEIRDRLLKISNLDLLIQVRDQLKLEIAALEPKTLPMQLEYIRNRCHATLLPGNPLLVDALQPNGALYRYFEQEKSTLVDGLTALVKKKVEQHINEIRSGACSSIEEVLLYLEEMSKRIQETLEHLPAESELKPFTVPWASIQGMVYRYAEVGKDWWLKFLATQGSIKKYYLEKSTQDILAKIEEQINRIADIILRKICEESLIALSPETARDGYQAASIYDEIRERLNRLRNRVIPALNRRWEDITRDRSTGSLKMITSRDTIESIAQDAAMLATAVGNRLKNTDVYRDLLSDGTQSIRFYDFVRRESEVIEYKLLQYYQPECWRAASVDILSQLSTERFSRQTILEVARGSYPWLQFAGGEAPNKGCDEPKIVVGPRSAGPKLQEICNDLHAMEERLPTFQVVEGLLDNMVVFYQESTALSLEDWNLESLLDELLKSGAVREIPESLNASFNNHYTHKLGALHFHPRLRTLVDELKFWIAVTELFREQLIHQDFLSLNPDTGTLFYSYTSELGMNDSINLGSDAEIANFAIADEGTAAQHFIDRIRQSIGYLGVDAVRETANAQWEANAQNRSEQKRIKSLSERLVKDLFPDALRERHPTPAAPMPQSVNGK